MLIGGAARRGALERRLSAAKLPAPAGLARSALGLRSRPAGRSSDANRLTYQQCVVGGKVGLRRPPERAGTVWVLPLVNTAHGCV